jgi:4-amino-4-deoxy-L-arabinose transferase-like glycosyltransferase
MTTIAPPTVQSGVAARSGLFARLRSSERQAAWVLPGTIAVLALAAVLYLVNLTVSGWANTYYSATAWAASQSWSAWFFGSIDPANFITVDKPPLATMVMGLSVRLFGLSSASILVPEALMGVATVGILMATVRRTFGAAASLIAGVVMALTPGAVLIFRYNNPDALLTLLLVAAAWALVRALESDRFRWLVVAGLLVGLAFNTKLLQAYLVLPAFALTFAVAAPGSVRRRLAGLVVAAGAVVVGSAWWVAAMELIPAAQRAYVGGSTNNSALDLVLGYDGLGRIFGQDGGAGGPGGVGGGGQGGGPGGGFSGTPGFLRLFNSQLGGQVAWFLPASIAGLIAGLVARFRAPRTDLARAGYLLWGTWLLVHALVFSFMSGIIHSYYVVAMAPAIGALVGGGAVTLWRARTRAPWAGFVLGVAILGTAMLGWLLLDRTPEFVSGLGLVAVVVAAVLVPVLTLGTQRVAVGRVGVGSRAALAAVTLGLAATLVGPVAYAVDTMQTAYGGGDPAAGPAAADARGGVGGPGAGGQVPGGSGQPPAGVGLAPGGIAQVPGGRLAGGFTGGAPGGPAGGASLSDSVVDYLLANQGSATWIVAVQGANAAGSLELQTGKAVMAMGGFSGGDDAPTLAGLQALVASGDLRFVAVGEGGGGPTGGSSGISSWVTTACSAVTIDGQATSVYDCAGVA